MVQVKSERRFSCVALFSSKVGFENSSVQKKDIRDFLGKFDLRIENYIDTAKHDTLSVDQISEKFSKIQQDILLIWRLDCLPASVRNMEDLFEILAALGQKGTSFISVQDGIDTDLSVQEFSIGVRNAWVDFKKNRKVTNGRASLLKAKSRKQHMGRKKIRDDDLIWKLRSEGLTIREIALNIGLSTTAVQRSLKACDKIQDEAFPL